MLVECAAHPVISIIADCSVILDVRNLFAYGKVNGVHLGGFQCGGEIIIYRGSLAVYPDKVGNGYIARHYIGLPAFDAIDVGVVLHLEPALFAAGGRNTFIVRAGGVTVDFHTLRQTGLRAWSLRLTVSSVGYQAVTVVGAVLVQ